MDPETIEFDTVFTQLRKKLDQRRKNALSLVDDGADTGGTAELLTIELGKFVASCRESSQGYKREKKSLLKIAAIAVETLVALDNDTF